MLSKTEKNFVADLCIDSSLERPLMGDFRNGSANSMVHSQRFANQYGVLPHVVQCSVQRGVNIRCRCINSVGKRQRRRREIKEGEGRKQDQNCLLMSQWAKHKILNSQHVYSHFPLVLSSANFPVEGCVNLTSSQALAATRRFTQPHRWK